jgi:hypothetical protein
MSDIIIGKNNAIIEPTFGIKFNKNIIKAHNIAKSNQKLAIIRKLTNAVIKLTIVFIIKYAFVSFLILFIIFIILFLFSWFSIINESLSQKYLYSNKINIV